MKRRKTQSDLGFWKFSKSYSENRLKWEWCGQWGAGRLSPCPAKLQRGSSADWSTQFSLLTRGYLASRVGERYRGGLNPLECTSMACFYSQIPMAEESLNGTYTEKWRVSQALTGLDLIHRTWDCGVLGLFACHFPSPWVWGPGRNLDSFWVQAKGFSGGIALSATNGKRCRRLSREHLPACASAWLGGHSCEQGTDLSLRNREQGERSQSCNVVAWEVGQLLWK